MGQGEVQNWMRSRPDKEASQGTRESGWDGGAAWDGWEGGMDGVVCFLLIYDDL